MAEPSVPAPDADKQSQLASFFAQATAKYSTKDFDAAADFYSQAAELSEEIHGELSPASADLLYAYGRCLYHVAVSKSDVLGSKVAGEREPEHRKPKKAKTTGGPSNGESEKAAEAAVDKAVEGKDAVKPEARDPSPANKPFFQFTGDENWDNSSDEEEPEAEDAEAEDGEEETDDLADAYEILDMARLCLDKKIQQLENEDKGKGKGKGKATEESKEIRDVRERLADTYDLQGEISLEGERFPTAVADLKASLAIKSAIFPPENSLLAEAHFKLSLALEFSSVTQEKDQDGAAVSDKDAQVDMAIREEAAIHMEHAIASCKLRVKKEEALLASLEANSEEAKEKAKGIQDVKDMVGDMEQRVSIHDP